MNPVTKWILTVAAITTITLGAMAKLVFSNETLETGTAAITAEELFWNVRFLTQKQFNGRGTMNGGHELPSLFLARELQKYGFQPLGDFEEPSPLNFGTKRSYFQTWKWRPRYHIEEKERAEDSMIESRNVLGFMEGTTHPSEIVIVSAHYDHLGGNYPGEKIYYGADDNASGVAAVLEIAEALGIKIGREKLKRSFLIAFWGAEEPGLIGSTYFVKNLPPEIKFDNIVAVVNLDMVGRNEPNELSCIGAQKGQSFEKVCPSLYKVIEKLAREFNFSMNYTVPIFGSSDHYSFFKAYPQKQVFIIPIFAFFTGVHKDYHKITDTYEKIDYEKLKRVSRLTFKTLMQINQTKKRPFCTK